MEVVEELPRLIPQLCYNVLGSASERNKDLLQDCMDQLSEFHAGTRDEERGPDHFNTDGLLRAAYAYQYMLYGIAAFSNRVYQLRGYLVPYFRLFRFNSLLMNLR